MPTLGRIWQNSRAPTKAHATWAGGACAKADGRGPKVRYLLLVSHGTFAPGLHSVLDMLLGPRDDVLSCSMEDGMGADAFVGRLGETIEAIGTGDEVVVLADIAGGSPLTNTLNVLASRGLLSETVAFGGANLPMALAAAMGADEDLASLGLDILSDGRKAIGEVVLAPGDEGEDEDDI